MLNTVYRLVEPRRIEAEFCDIDLNSDNVLVRPTHLSICNADQRYFQGYRSAEILKAKLPMALIHEGIGRIVYDKRREYSNGQRVVMIPNTPYERDEVVAENYLRSSKFRASGFDGFMQDIVSVRRDRVIALSDDLDDYVAAFTELVSVAYHAILRMESRSHRRKESIGVWGDGNLAYLTALLLRNMYRDSNLYVFGKHDYKMMDFSFADDIFNISDIPEKVRLDHAFECVGGSASGAAINQIIDRINPEGTISAMGVSEDPVSLNTRMILEKGLTMYGSSRSGYSDFMGVLGLYKSKPDIEEHLSRIVGEIITVRNVSDMVKAFDSDIRKSGGKTIMIWEK